MDKEGGYVNRQPLLDDSNYGYWKSRMIDFLKSLDSRSWKAVLRGWDHPKIKDANGVDTAELKPEEEWSANEDTLALGNSKALNALFNGVDKNMFKLIKNCTVVKDAWEILKTTHEGTAKVKISRLQMLTRKFENLTMKEDESIHDFYMTMMDYANSFDILGEKMNDEKLDPSLPTHHLTHQLSYTALQKNHTLSQFMHAPTVIHFNAACRVSRYLKNNPGQGILFSRESELHLT
ncbi:gag-pol polyprotein [Trifolium medium]|uniref:Gag-pol polyprotein n=1 Tax=Trifolium medium TaxID=97028 RepID=A0A392N0K7_9FABA|nr:gag-pol polyprotein [Trifolium medium]